MRRLPLLNLFAGISLAVVTTSVNAANAVPSKFMTLDQKIDAATLQRYHHTDQGTRLVPAAWMEAVQRADGKGRYMGQDNLRELGFIVDNPTVDALNPYGWPVGFTVSVPKTKGEVPIGGITCAACHTGQIEYKGTAIRIEGGQGMHDGTLFFDGLAKAFVATAKDPARRAQFFVDAVKAGYPAERMEADYALAVDTFHDLAETPPGPALVGITEGPGRADAVQGIANKIFGGALKEPANRRARNTPVSIPYVWDIYRFTWVQTNGFQFGPQTLSRNLGEALGVFGKMNILNPETGELNPEPLRWKTSLQMDNLIWMEKTLQGLRAPVWPAEVLGPIDAGKAARGKELFSENCARCHGIKVLPDGSWDVAVVSLDQVGTDPLFVYAWAGALYDASKLGLGDKVTAWQALPVVANAVRRQLYADNNTPVSEQEGDTVHEAACGYKARPLIGVWATPPFLHNGSVPTLFDMLSDVRPAKFIVGSREFDPVKVGYVEGPSLAPLVIDTSLPGNQNIGHWFTDEESRPGRIGAKFSDDDKYAIIEFLKSATYDNYPSEKRESPRKMACQGQQDWALKK